MAGEWLRLVRQPTLLIVGERDIQVVQLNHRAREMPSGTTRLVIVPGASHLFEEPGALDQVARLAATWFVEHLAGPDRTVAAGKVAEVAVEIGGSDEMIRIDLTHAEARRLCSAIAPGYEGLSRAEYCIRSGLSKPAGSDINLPEVGELRSRGARAAA